ncbi:MAG: sensor histidine kinase [Nitrospirae bacterium]|nr:MAG: sensor histidine kinase [Nitrospirota bacterium]
MDLTVTAAATPRRRTGLKRKLVLSMLLVGVLPLAIGLVMAFWQGTQEIRQVNGASFQALATSTAKRIDLIITDEISHTSHLATDVHLIQELERRRDLLADIPAEELAILIDRERQRWEAQDPSLVKPLTQGSIAQILHRYYGGTYTDPGHPVPVVARSATRALIVTDLAGRLVASLDSNVDYVHVQEAWWQGAFHNGVGQPYLGPLTFDPRYQRYVIAMALPIMDSLRYQAIGVLLRVYDAKEFFAPSVDTIRFGKTGHVMLIDSRGAVLSCPILPTGTTLSDPELIRLVTPMRKGWVLAPSDGHGGTDASIIGYAPLPNASRITRNSSGVTLHMFVWQSSEELFAPIKHLFTWITVFGMLSVGLLIALGAIAATRIVTPIKRLQEAAQLIGRGELQTPISLTTGDELEELAEEMNRMHRQLSAAFAGLESQVELKTQEVQYLQESTAQILDSIPDPIIMLDQEGRVQYVNRAGKDALGVETDGALEGQPLSALLHTDDSTHRKLQYELEMLTTATVGRSGVAGSTSSSAVALRDPLSPPPDVSVGTLRNEIHVNHRTYRYEWFTVRGRAGQQPRVGLVLRDITDESRLQEQLIQGEKLASLGVLSAGIGHELNNPLVGVIGLGEAIQEETDPEQIREYAKTIVHHGRRMASIIRDFTGQGTVPATEMLMSVDINEQLQHALRAAQQANPSEGITVQTDFADLPAIRANPIELSQAFMNIMTNALQAMQGQGTLEISTRLQDGTIRVVIRDTGPGIPRAHLSKAFDPFFTTKRQGEGAGLGLTIARRIITKYGGQIHLESEVGQGTTCTILFPAPPKAIASQGGT